MKRKLATAAAAFVAVSGSAFAHNCPYEWNIQLTKGIAFKETSISKINAAVREATKGRIQTAVILDTTPATITKETADPEMLRLMDVLIDRYQKVMAPVIAKGAAGYETCPVTDDIKPNFPLACQISTIAAGAEMRYREKKEGAVLSRWPKTLECRAYKVSDAFLKRVEEKQKAGQIHPDFKPVPVVFAQESGMSWSVMVGDGPGSFRGNAILDAVTFYMPDKKLMLTIETSKGHNKILTNLKKLGYWQE
ncbi:MAG: hypothetical protein WCV67_06645 [Victivallaceae bacterium]|jgi:hypothetical protein